MDVLKYIISGSIKNLSQLKSRESAIKMLLQNINSSCVSNEWQDILEYFIHH